MKNHPKHRIIMVDKSSVADEIGVQAGDFLVSINGAPVLDIIDYEQFMSSTALRMQFETADGALIDADIEKEEEEDMGLTFESSLMSPVRSCRNHCIFCFIDQMPRGGRRSLHVKDDDWRLSLIMGNYVTLTNTDDAEFKRIIERRVSPLYISVHATDKEVRKLMMKNDSAGLIMERLAMLKRANIAFHCQIVLCPGINDGEVLKATLLDLSRLEAESVAVVPVGLTRYRKSLHPLRCIDKEGAIEAIATIDAFRKKGLRVFAADELYLTAKLPLPPYESYGDFPQIENGVGLLRKFEFEFFHELKTQKNLAKPRVFNAVTGVLASGFLSSMFSNLNKYGIKINTYVVPNGYFGHTITVSGLVTAKDIMERLPNKLSDYPLLIPQCMLREGDDVFLDGMTVLELESALGVKIHVMPSHDGAAFIKYLFELRQE